MGVQTSVAVCLKADVNVRWSVCVSENQVRSSAESDPFCVSQPVTSTLGAGHWEEEHLLSSSLSLFLYVFALLLSYSTIALIRFTSHHYVC